MINNVEEDFKAKVSTCNLIALYVYYLFLFANSDNKLFIDKERGKKAT